MNKRVGYAVIGCGMISGFHISAIKDTACAELIGVYDAFEMARRRTAEMEGVKCYETLEQIWNDSQVDAVCICVPSGLHGAIAVEALKNKKHVLIEKPLALTTEDCDKIQQQAVLSERLVGVVSQLRFSPVIQRVKRAMERNLLGRLVGVDLYMKYYRDPEYYSSSAWRGTKAMDGGGALMNQGIHGVDLVQYLVGMPKLVFARSRTLVHKIEVEDSISAVIEYPNGALGVIQATTCIKPGFCRRLELHGTEGSIVLEEDRIVLWDAPDDGWSTDTESEISQIKGNRDPAQIGQMGHRRQIENFTQAVLGKDTLLIDAGEGRKAVDLILAAYASAESGMPVNFQGA